MNSTYFLMKIHSLPMMYVALGGGGILKAPDLNLTKAGDLTHKL